MVAMGLAFHASSPYRDQIVATAESMRQLVLLMLGSESAAIFVAERSGQVVGMIGMSAFVHPLSFQMAAHEVFWWVNPEARGSAAAIRLLHAGETWARAQGATVVQMVAPDAAVGVIYQRLGYQAIETMYQRRLT